MCLLLQTLQRKRLQQRILLGRKGSFSLKKGTGYDEEKAVKMAYGDAKILNNPVLKKNLHFMLKNVENCSKIANRFNVTK